MKLSDKGNSDFQNRIRFILTRLTYHTIQVHTPSNPETGLSKVLLSLNRGAGRPVTVDLSALTVEELAAFKESVLIATEAARPICVELDRRAQEAMQNGDDADPRTYRSVPVVFVRPGSLAKYDRRLLDGRKDVLQGVQFNVMQSNGVSEPGGDLDEHVQVEQDGTEDNP